MIELSDPRFLNPVWHALHGPHRHLAIGSGAACRYPADVAPFAAIEAGGPAAHLELRALLGVGESLWVAGAPDHPGLRIEQELDCVQMVLPGDTPRAPAPAPMRPPVFAPVPDPVLAPEPEPVQAPEPAASGSGIVPLSLEHAALEGYPQISGICTHPEHRGLADRLSRRHNPTP
jgi:hypothetical protein